MAGGTGDLARTGRTYGGGLAMFADQHIASRVDQPGQFREHYTSVEHLLDVWTIECDDSLRAMARALKHGGCPTLHYMLGQFAGAPSSNHGPLTTDTVTLYHVVRVLHEEDVGLLAGIDQMAMFGSPDLMSQLGLMGQTVDQELRALVAAGLMPYEALAAAIRDPAAYCGRTTVTHRCL